MPKAFPHRLKEDVLHALFGDGGEDLRIIQAHLRIRTITYEKNGARLTWGMNGLLGVAGIILLIVSQRIIPENSLLSTSKPTTVFYKHNKGEPGPTLHGLRSWWIDFYTDT